MIRARKTNRRQLVELRKGIYFIWMSGKEDFLEKQHVRGKGKSVAGR